MTMIRKVLLGMLAIATVLGVSAAAVAAPSVSATGTGGANLGVDGSSQLNDLHGKVYDGIARVEGVAGQGVDATGNVNGKLDATTDHAGVSASGAGSATLSQKIGDAFAKIRGVFDRVFSLGGELGANGGVNGSGAVDASNDGARVDGNASGHGSALGKLGAKLSGLLHLSG